MADKNEKRRINRRLDKMTRLDIEREIKTATAYIESYPADSPDLSVKSWRNWRAEAERYLSRSKRNDAAHAK